jgi:aryl-alcohol dehydrogenase (NADP+)
MDVELASFPAGGLRVPRIGLGTSGFSAETSVQASRILHAADERGLTFLDTADTYGHGASEEIIGRTIAGRRDRFIISTKCGYRPESQGASRRSLRLAVEGSLRRLDTDRIDILHLHRMDPVTPMEETVSALQDLVRSGKILYYGFSNAAGWQMVDAAHTARALGGASPLSLQTQISALARENHAQLVAPVMRAKMGLIAVSPLARGLLGRPYSADTPPPVDHPLRSAKGYLTWTENNLRLAERLRATATEKSCSSAQLALALVLSLPAVVTAIARPRLVSDLDDYIAAPNIKIDRSDLTRIGWSGDGAADAPPSLEAP